MDILFKNGMAKCVTLSYDDGKIFDKKLVDILNRHGLRCTFNLNSGLLNTSAGTGNNTMSLEQAQQLFIGSHHEVAIHGYKHLHMESLNHTELMREIIEDKKQIETDFHCIARGMAYPFGTYNADVLSALSLCGIKYARTVRATESFDLPQNWLELNPTCHHRSPKLMEIAEEFVNGTNHRYKMFYLWGHSYEFNNDNNWEVIENFADFIGGRDDIWYATNIEIYDYVNAYNSLNTSYDGKYIQNTSAIPVWVRCNERTYKINPGETVEV